MRTPLTQAESEDDPSMGFALFSSIDFRPLTRADFPQLISLHQLLFPVEYNDEFYESLLGNTIRTVLAVFSGNLIGVATGRLVDRSSCCVTDRRGYIITFGVAEEYRRYHLGTELLLRLQMEFEQAGATLSYLHAKADNYSALSFYKKNKYQVMRRLPNYYFIDGGYHDAYALSRPLPRPPVQCLKWLRRLVVSCCGLCLSPWAALQRWRRSKLKSRDYENTL
eukprot:NODE_1531_length_864_cov_328.889571_g1185_i1.p1 GENE.NODE_1531_length_864_cov_328.889571_g1185_i1~~NODE_1531_length_864_cov_328.889571_g1185_i1.p1  ORF type:complete len:223 (-),score=7.70 NODE_1531_length_864_cov_328.889571_g1185_i1:97-765(-)